MNLPTNTAAVVFAKPIIPKETTVLTMVMCSIHMSESHNLKILNPATLPMLIDTFVSMFLFEGYILK